MRRVVLDANVLLSALLGGRTRPLLDALLARRFHLITSETLLEELASVLARPEWRRVLEQGGGRELLAILREATTVVRPTRHVTICRDPTDNALLDCARIGRADVLVTGDKDLLVLQRFHGTRILPPRDFLKLFA